MADRPLDRVLARLAGVKTSGGGQVARCPAHDDARQSLSVTEGDDGRVLLHCHTGCSPEAVAAALGLTLRDLFAPNAGSARPAPTTRPRIVETYDYRDESGELLYQAVRLDPKDFRQRRPDPNKPGSWLWNLSSVRRMLYRLPELRAADPAQPVYVVEGEKDVENLRALGLVATCNVGGAGKWADAYSLALAGRHVVIVPDLDTPGIEHAEKVARALAGVAASVRVLRLPDLGPVAAKHGRDVTDWLAAGGTAERLAELAGQTALYDPDDDGDGRPWIAAYAPDLLVVVGDAWQAIAAKNDPPRLFVFGGDIVRVTARPGEPPASRALTDDGLWRELLRCARFYEEKTEGKDRETVRVWVDPPDRVIRAMADADAPPLPILERIVEAPSFTRDGALLASPGYDSKSRTLYHPTRSSAMPAVPEQPTPDDIARAYEWIRCELLGDFPFAGDADRANALALFLLPLIRGLVRGATPLFVVEAPTPGSGKGKLVEAVIAATSGRKPSPLPEARDEDEWRKRITSALLEGHAVIFLDNVRKAIDSAVLAATLTADIVTDRVLGKTATIRVPNRAVWAATGNNLTFSTEIARRIVRIRLTPQEDRPWLRQTFRHPSLIEWAIEHQGDGVWAGAVLVRAWLAAGRPAWQGRAIGSFEEWSRITGGILDRAGVTGFLDNALDLYEQSDMDGAALRALVAGWWEQHQTNPVGVKDLIPLAREVDGLPLGRRDDSERSQRTQLGMFLRRHRDTVVGGYQILPAGTRQGGALWVLRDVASGNGREPEEPCEPSRSISRTRAPARTCACARSTWKVHKVSEVHTDTSSQEEGELF